MQYLLPLLSVVLGYLVAILLKPKNKKNIKLLLAFSGAFLLSITVMHLLPEVYHSAEKSHKTELVQNSHTHHEHSHDHHHDDHDNDHDHVHDDNCTHHNHGEVHNHDHDDHDHSGGYTIGLFIMIGILFQIILEFFSKGAEHGHVHSHDKMNSMPWTLFVSLCLHALLEGMPVSHHHDLAIGIAIHHLPIAIILTTFFVNAGLNKKWVLIFMVVFAFMTPLGTLASEKLPFLTHYYTEISAIVIGILFHISSTIIFESSENHKFNFAKISVIVLGIVLAYFV